MPNPAADQSECWPSLPLASWQDTCATLHMWTQIVGKVRLELTPLVNHWWNVPLYVSTRGLTTSRIPYGQRAFEIWFDFIRHELMLETSDGVLKFMPLGPKSVADFYREFLAMLRSAGIEVKIWHMPVEIPDPIPFDQDQVHRSYDPVAVEKFWRILLSVDAVFGKFRAGFIGKNSPVHFFWGSFDLAVTRFSGRPAPERPGADAVTREAYSQEVISFGFWPGNGGYGQAAFYAYAAPEPEGFGRAKVQPAAAFYGDQMKEFFLNYDDVRKAESPRKAILDFMGSVYKAGSVKWDHAALERSEPFPAKSRALSA